MQCQWCKQEFSPKRSDAVFCSTKCRVAAHRASKPKFTQEKFCDYCGSMTQPGQPHRYCSNACRQAAYRKRNPQHNLKWDLKKQYGDDLQAIFDAVERLHLTVRMYDWKWKGAKVVRRRGNVYLEPGPDSFKMFDGTYLGKDADRAIDAMITYYRTGYENAASRRHR
jgi:ribosomal protein L24E